MGMGLMDLFAAAASTVRKQGAPLAERMRPRSLDEFSGQTDIVGPGKILRRIFEEEKRRTDAKSTSLSPLPSIILWGPPGTGKTTLAFLLLGSQFFRRLDGWFWLLWSLLLAAFGVSLWRIASTTATDNVNHRNDDWAALSVLEQIVRDVIF